VAKATDHIYIFARQLKLTAKDILNFPQGITHGLNTVFFIS